ncbi:MAG: DUF4160 domain-containing protein [Solirubrobacteraceae bacterium]
MDFDLELCWSFLMTLGGVAWLPWPWWWLGRSFGVRGFAERPYDARVSPTVFREGPYRFFFFSREEPRLHIHVQSPDGEAKFWLAPKIELARNYGLTAQDLKRVERLVEEHEQEITDAWHEHFER